MRGSRRVSGVATGILAHVPGRTWATSLLHILGQRRALLRLRGSCRSQADICALAAPRRPGEQKCGQGGESHHLSRSHRGNPSEQGKNGLKPPPLHDDFKLPETRAARPPVTRMATSGTGKAHQSPQKAHTVFLNTASFKGLIEERQRIRLIGSHRTTMLADCREGSTQRPCRHRARSPSLEVGSHGVWRNPPEPRRAVTNIHTAGVRSRVCSLGPPQH